MVANAPQANDVSSTVNEDSSVTIQLDGSSPGGESVTYSIVSNPSNGSLASISGSNVTYTPNQDYNGSDSFTYKVNNGSQDSNTATVTLTINAVNDAPVANNISAETNFNDAVDLQFDASDVDGDNLSYFIVSGASNGTLTLHSNNQVEYLPNSGFSVVIHLHTVQQMGVLIVIQLQLQLQLVNQLNLRSQMEEKSYLSTVLII